MRDPKSWVRLPFLAVIVVAAACAPPDGSVSRFADERATSPAVAPVAAPRIEGDESMAALTAEVRQLRLAVEALARSQTETQALGVYLSAQQSRISQVARQLDAVREEIDSVTASSRDLDERVKGFQDELSGQADRELRAGLENAIRATEAERNGLELKLQQALSRENDLSRALALEETRWNDALARMQRLTQ